MTDATLRVFVDEAAVWEGELGPEAMGFQGPIGVRSDNAVFEGELSAPGGAKPGACAKGTDEGE
jgi:hypothetical protein